VVEAQRQTARRAAASLKNRERRFDHGIAAPFEVLPQRRTARRQHDRLPGADRIGGKG